MIARSHWFRRFVVALLGASLVAVAVPAEAGPFKVRASRPSYPEAEVARPVTLEKEWAEFSLTYRFREVSQYTNSNGELRDTTYDYRMSWLTLDARYGFTKNLTMYMSLPYSVMSQRTGGNDGEDEVNGTGLGDVRFGLTWQAYHRTSDKAMTSIAVRWDNKQPSGNESPGVPGDRHLLLGTGTTNSGLELIAKQRLGPIAALASAGYTHKFSAVTMWVRDTNANGLNGRFKPGDEITAGLHLIGQPLGFAALDVGADYVNRFESSVGSSNNGVNPGAGLERIRNSDFEALNASGRLIVQANQNWDFVGGVSHPVFSRNSGKFFPLEDLSQSYGTTFTGAVFFRW